MMKARRSGFMVWFHKRDNPLRQGGALLTIGILLFGQVAWAQQIVPDGRTQTQIDINGNTTDVTTGTLHGVNAINSFSKFDVYQGNIVNLHVPGQATNLLNLVHGQVSQIDGILNAYKNGAIGGNVYFANPHGIVIGAGGVVNVGSLTLITPTPEFMEGFFDASGNPSNGGTADLLGGAAPLNPEALISIQGQVHARQAIGIEAGRVVQSGALIAGPAALQGMVDFSGLVNIGDLQPAAGLVVENGQIRIVAVGDVEIAGRLSAEGTDNIHGGQIDIRAGNNLTVDGDAVISAAGKGENSQGGVVYSWAENDAVLAGQALIDVSAGSSGDGGFAEFSAKNRVILAGGAFDASAASGALGGVLIDPADITVASNIFANGNYSLLADHSITVNDGVMISSRRVTGADTFDNHLTGNSSGHSGDISLEAPNITLGSGVYLLAQADNGWSAGNISLLASDISNNVVGFGLDLQSNSASIVLNNARLFGKDITFSATAGNTRLFDDVAGSSGENADTGGFMNDVLDFLDDASLIGAVSRSKATATVEILGGSIDASGNLTVHSDAKSDASAQIKSMIVGFAYSESEATADSTIGEGTTIQVGGDFSLTSAATAKSHTETETFSYGIGNPTTLDVTLVVSNTRGSSNAVIEDGATVTVGDQLTVRADTHQDVKTVAKSGAYEDGQVGIAIALSYADMDAKALVDGTVTDAANGITIAANVKTDSASGQKNQTVADATAGSGLLQKLIVGGASSVLGKLTAKSGSASGGQKSNAGAASGNGLAASWAYAEHTSDAVARIGDDAAVKSSAGTIDIDALVEDKIEISARSFVNSTDTNIKKNSLAAAVVTGNYANTAQAYIGDRATVDAGNAIEITSHTNLPQKSGYQIDSIDDVTEYLNTNAGVQNAFANSWAQSAAQAADVGLAGSVNILNVSNRSEASIGQDARINQNLDAADQDVTVEAFNTLETVNVAGIFGIKLIASNASGGTGVGGSYLGSNYSNITSAYIKDGALVDANALTVRAESRNSHINVAEAGGLAKQYSINGAFTFADIDDRTLARIDGGAIIDAGSHVQVTALDESTYFSASGGFSWGSGAAIGASVAWNDLTRDTRALIGNLPDETVGGGSLSSGGDVTVTSTNSGQIDSWSLAAAMSTQNPPFTGIDKSAPKNSGTFGLGISANVALNEIDDITHAAIEIPELTAGNVTVAATEDSNIEAVGGAVAITRQSGGSSSALAGTWSQNTILSDTRALVGNSTMTLGGTLDVTAATIGEIMAVAASGSGAPQTGMLNVAGSVTVNEIDGKTSAAIENSSIAGKGADPLADVLVAASNEARILSVSGSASFGGQAGVGAGVALNTISGLTDAHIDGSDIDAGGQVKVTAETGSTTTDQEIVTVSAAIAGNGSSSALAAAAAVSINDIDNTTSASISGQKSDQGVRAGTDIVVAASDDADIYTVAGNLAGTGGTAGFGGSFAQNTINSSVAAQGENTRLEATAGKIDFDASTLADISAVAAGGVGAGTLAIGGSVTLNEIATGVEARFADSDIDAAGAVGLQARDASLIRSLAGTVTGAGTVSVGAALATNTIGNTVSAVIDASTVDSTGSTVSLTASENSTIESLSAGVSGAGTAAITGAVSLNQIGNVTEAHVGNGSTVTAAQDITLAAGDVSTIRSLSGQATGAGVAAIGGAAAYNEIANITRVHADDSTLTSTAGSLALSAASEGEIETIAAGGSVGGKVGVAGSVAINLIASDTLAYLNNTDATANGNVTILADADNTLQTYAGSLGGGAVGIAGSVVVNTLDNDTRAYISEGRVEAKGNGAAATVKSWNAVTGVESTEGVQGLAVVASSREKIDSRSMTVSLGAVGIGGNTSVTTVNDTTLGYIDSALINSVDDPGGAVKVKAHQNTEISNHSGAASAGGAAIGGAVDVSLIGNVTQAYITDGTPLIDRTAVFAQGVEVNALSREKVKSSVAGVSVGGFSVAGAVSVAETSSTTEAFIKEADVNSDGNLTVLANTGTDLDLRAGLLAAGAAVGAGGSVAVGNIGTTTKAYLIGAETNAKGATTVDARSVEKAKIQVGTAGAGGMAGLAGAVAVNSIDADTHAFVDSGTRASRINQDANYATTTQDVTVSAKDTATIDDDAGTLAVGGAVGVGATVDVTTIKNDTRAYIGNNTTVNAGRNVLVKAESAKSVDSLVVAFAAGAVGIQGAVSVVAVGSGLDSSGAGEADDVAGSVNGDVSLSGGVDGIGSDSTAARAKAATDRSVSINDDLSTAAVTRETSAYLGDGAAVTAGNTIKVDARDVTRVDIIAGGAALGLAGVGGSVGIATLRNRTNAYTGSAVLSADGNIEVTANGNINDSDVEVRTGVGGLVALGAGYAKIDSDNDVAAFLGTGARVDKAADVKVLANSTSDVRAFADGKAIGGAAVGVVIADAKETGTTQAYLGYGVDIADDDLADGAESVNNLVLSAGSLTTVTSTGQASSGGVAAATGVDTQATADPTTRAYILSSAANRADIDLNGSLNITADADSQAHSTATGAATGGLAVGVSLAKASTSPTVSASVGDYASIRTGGNVDLKALFNRNIGTGAGIGDAANANAKSSGGSLFAAGVGSNAKVNATLNVSADLGANSDLAAGGSVAIGADGYLDNTAVATGKATGLVTAGGVESTAIVTSTVASTLGTGAQVSTATNFDQKAQSQAKAIVSSVGGSGVSTSTTLKNLFTGNFGALAVPSFTSYGGAGTVVTLNNTAAVTMAANAGVEAVQALTVLAKADSSADAYARMDTSGLGGTCALAASDVYVDSDATVTVQSGAKLAGRDLSLTADNDIHSSSKARAISYADLAASFATALAKNRVGSSVNKAQGKVRIENGADLTGQESIALQATTNSYGGNLLSDAYGESKTSTVAAIAAAEALGEAYVDALVETVAGSLLNTIALDITADTTATLERKPDALAEPVTQLKWVVSYVTEKIVKWMPYPLDNIVKWVVREVWNLVEFVLGGSEIQRATGAGLQSTETVRLNGDVHIGGAATRTLLIKADGSIDPASDIIPTFAGADVIVPDIVNNSSGSIDINVPQGYLVGNGTLYINKILENVSINNSSDLNLVINDIDMMAAKTSNPDLKIRSQGTTFDIQFESDVNQSSIDIVNTGSGNVMFNKQIENYFADYSISATGGDLLAKDNSVFLEGRNFTLLATEGRIGTAANALRLNFIPGSAPAQLDAFAYGPINLDLSLVNPVNLIIDPSAPTNAALPPDFQAQGLLLNDIRSFGDISLKINNGVARTTEATMRVVLEPLWNPITGVIVLVPEMHIDTEIADVDVDGLVRVNNITTGGNVVLDNPGNRMTLQIDGMVQSGYDSIAVNLAADGTATSNLPYNFIASQDATTIVLKDLLSNGASSGNITLNAKALTGSGLLKAHNGYTEVAIANGSGKDLVTNLIDVGTRGGGTVQGRINGILDPGIAHLEYPSLRVELPGSSDPGGAVGVITTGGGALQVNKMITTAGGAVLLSSQGNLTLAAEGDVFSAGSGDLFLTSASGAITMQDGAVVDGGTGNVTLSASENVALGELRSTNGEITVTAGSGSSAAGAIFDNTVAETANIVTAGGVTLSARTGIGAAGAGDIDTTVGQLQTTNSSSGDIVIRESDSLVVNGTGIRTLGSNGNIRIDVAAGNLTVDSGVSADGSGTVLLNADTGSITVNAAVGSTIGNLAVTGDSVSQNANLSTGGSGSVTVTADHGGIAMTDGAVTTSETGSIEYGATADVALAQLASMSGTIAVTAGIGSSATGAILDNTGGETANIITPGTLTLTARTGIGAAGAGDIDTTVGQLQATNSTSGDILIRESDGLVVNGTGIRTLGSNGSISVAVEAGHLTVDSGVAADGSGAVLLNADAGAITVNAAVGSTTGNIAVTGDRVTQNANLTTGGSGSVTVTADNGGIAMTDGTVTTSETGSIEYRATADVALSQLISTSGALRVTSGGAILDNTSFEGANLVTDGTADLSAATGIGMTGAGDIDTTIGQLQATNSTAGDIVIEDTGNLSILRIEQEAADGEVTVTAAGDLAVAAGGGGITAVNGEVLLDAGGGLAINDRLNSQAGAIDLLAAGDVIFGTAGGVLSVSGPVTVAADAEGNGSGAIWMADGAQIEAGTGTIGLTAPGDIVLGSVRTGNDTAAAVMVASTDGDIVIGLIDAPQGDTVLQAGGSILARHADAINEINTNTLTFSAQTGTFGLAADPIRVDTSMSRPGLVRGIADLGIFLTESANDLRVDTLAAPRGDIVLVADGAILNRTAPGGINLVGENLTLASNHGDIGEPASFFRVDSNGTVNAEAYGNIYLEEVNGDFNSDYLIAHTGDLSLRVSDGSATLGRLVAGRGISLLVHGPGLSIGSIAAHDLLIALPMEGSRLEIGEAEIGYRIQAFADYMEFSRIHHTGATSSLHLTLAGNDGGLAESVDLYADSPGGIQVDRLRSNFASVHANVDQVRFEEVEIGTYADLRNSRNRVVVDNRARQILHPADVQLYSPERPFSLFLYGDRLVKTDTWVVHYDGDFLVNHFATENSVTRLSSKRLYQNNDPEQPPRQHRFYSDRSEMEDWPYLTQGESEAVEIAPALLRREARNLIGSVEEMGLLP
jgi:filamentous hemagglutinin family protein